jgi:hypothetical protein
LHSDIEYKAHQEAWCKENQSDSCIKRMERWEEITEVRETENGMYEYWCGYQSIGVFRSRPSWWVLGKSCHLVELGVFRKCYRSGTNTIEVKKPRMDEFSHWKKTTEQDKEAQLVRERVETHRQIVADDFYHKVDKYAVTGHNTTHCDGKCSRWSFCQ